MNKQTRTILEKALRSFMIDEPEWRSLPLEKLNRIELYIEECLDPDSDDYEDLVKQIYKLALVELEAKRMV